MCVIIACSRKDAHKVPLDVLSIAAQTQPHGWGLLVRMKNDTFQVQKGWVEKTAIAAWEQAIRNRKVREVIMHFRYTSRGVQHLDNIHPFPCDAPDGEKRWLFHNGTLKKIPLLDGHLSDSAQFAKYLTLRNTTPELKKELSAYVRSEGSRFAFVTSDSTTLMGDGWVERDGVWYSNKKAWPASWLSILELLGPFLSEDDISSFDLDYERNDIKVHGRKGKKRRYLIQTKWYERKNENELVEVDGPYEPIHKDAYAKSYASGTYSSFGGNQEYSQNKNYWDTYFMAQDEAIAKNREAYANKDKDKTTSAHLGTPTPVKLVSTVPAICEPARSNLDLAYESSRIGGLRVFWDTQELSWYYHEFRDGKIKKTYCEHPYAPMAKDWSANENEIIGWPVAIFDMTQTSTVSAMAGKPVRYKEGEGHWVTYLFRKGQFVGKEHHNEPYPNYVGVPKSLVTSFKPVEESKSLT